MTNKVLITGGSGYVGSSFINSYSSDFNISFTSRPCSSSFRSSHSAPFNVPCDLSSPSFVDSLPCDKFDTLIHLAQSKNYRDFPNSSLDIFDINVAATQRLLEFARSRSIKRFIFASTASIFSSIPSLITEELEPKPESFYARSKFIAENLVTAYRDFFEIIILRIFTVYGPHQNNTLVPNIYSKILNQMPISLANKTGPILTPIFIHDLTRALSHLIEIDLPSPFLILNLCGSEHLSLAQMTKYISETMSCKPVLVYPDSTSDFCITGSNQLLLQLLPGFPFTPFTEGISTTIKSFS